MSKFIIEIEDSAHPRILEETLKTLAYLYGLGGRGYDEMRLMISEMHDSKRTPDQDNVIRTYYSAGLFVAKKSKTP